MITMYKYINCPYNKLVGKCSITKPSALNTMRKGKGQVADR